MKKESIASPKKPTKVQAKKQAKKPVKKAVSKTLGKKSAPVGSDSSLKVGDTAPSFSLLSDDGTLVSSKGLKGQTVVLYFYPKDMTSGCTLESCDFRDSFPKFKKRGVVVLGISKDSIDSHLKFKSKYSLPFPLLADIEGKMCEAYGVWKEKSMYGRKYMGIERSTFVISPEGKIAAIYPKVKVTNHVEAVLNGILA
ncbi:MAG: thioredoxin-dependent thiol peroxidase [Bdellovibrionia bacterium]